MQIKNAYFALPFFTTVRLGFNEYSLDICNVLLIFKIVPRANETAALKKRKEKKSNTMVYLVQKHTFSFKCSSILIILNINQLI